jgi:hypothetical protein
VDCHEGYEMLMAKFRWIRKIYGAKNIVVSFGLTISSVQLTIWGLHHLVLLFVGKDRLSSLKDFFVSFRNSIKRRGWHSYMMAVPQAVPNDFFQVTRNMNQGFIRDGMYQNMGGSYCETFAVQIGPFDFFGDICNVVSRFIVFQFYALRGKVLLVYNISLTF